MARVKQLAAAVAPRGASLEDVIVDVSKRIGAEIRVRRGDDLHGPTAVVTLLTDKSLALIQVDRGVEDERVPYVVGHELGHLVLGHGSGERRHYDTEAERDAELFGTEVVRRMRMSRLGLRSQAVR